jgi:REP element-mobilizing transposase RayT
MYKTPLAYLITFTTYGTWLHGNSRGSIIEQQDGTQLLKHEARLESYQKQIMMESPFVLDERSRNIILQAMLDVARHRNWIIPAIHIRTSHIHSVIKAHLKPKRIMNDLKVYATRALRANNYSRNHFWTHHGSTRYLYTEAKIQEAVHYVIYEQGEPMTLYAQPL